MIAFAEQRVSRFLVLFFVSLPILIWRGVEARTLGDGLIVVCLSLISILLLARGIPLFVSKLSVIGEFETSSANTNANYGYARQNWRNACRDGLKFACFSLLGPIILLLLTCSAEYALACFRERGDPSRKNPNTVLAQQVAKDLSSSFPTLLLPKHMVVAISLSAIIWGTGCYSLITYFSFTDLYNTLTNQAEPETMRAYMADAARPDPNTIAQDLLRKTPVEGLDQLPAAIKQARVGLNGQGSYQRLSAIHLAANLMAEGQCAGGDCGIAAPISELLAGTPGARSDLIACWLRGVRDGGKCKPGEAPSPWTFIGLTGLAGTDAGWSPLQVAELFLKPQECEGDMPSARCAMAISVMQMAMDDPEVRSKLTYEVGFIYGWGRLAVAVLFFAVLVNLLYRQCARVQLEGHYIWTLEWMETNRPLKDGRISLDFDNYYGPLRSANGSKLQSACGGADPRLHPVPAALYAAVQDLSESQCINVDSSKDCAAPPRGGSQPSQSNNDNHVFDASEIPIVAARGSISGSQTHENLDNCEELVSGEFNRWRESFTSIVTLFPVIGFSATLLGLVAALGGADQIAIKSGDSRASAIREMVGLLSSCFSTTFLALLCMSVIAIASQRQGYAESNAFRATYFLLKRP